MDILKSMSISGSGMSANRKRLEAISSNIANANTIDTPEGGPYRRKEVVFAAEPARQKFSDIIEGQIDEDAQAVYVKDIISSNRPPLLKYEPNNPNADEKGYVAYPNINTMEETADMISAQRDYEANANALNVSKSMALKALEIGRN
jgi:flagellar basal-body rod protein FlgC